MPETTTAPSQPSPDHPRTPEQGLGFLNDYFDKVFLFSIRRNQDTRLPRMAKVLEGLEYEVFWGLDQKEHSLEELRKRYLAGGGELFPGHFHAVLTHGLGFRMFLQHAFEGGYEKVLFIEDDFSVAPGGKATFQAALEELASPPISDGWDIVHFHSHVGAVEADRPHTSWEYLHPPKLPRDVITEGGMHWKDWNRAKRQNPTGDYPLRFGRQYVPDGRGGFLRHLLRGYREFTSTLCIGLQRSGIEALLKQKTYLAGDNLCGSLSATFDYRPYVVTPFPCHAAEGGPTLEYPTVRPEPKA